jgi:TolA-binding protein
MNRTTFLCLLIAGLFALPPAQAGTKEDLARLQADVLALQNQIREFDKNFNERIDGIKSLVVQLNDQVAKSSLTLGKISSSLASLESQNSEARTAQDALLQEIRKLSGKIDESATRISAMATQLNELKVQAKTLNQDSASAGASLSPEAMYDLAYRDFVQGNLDLAIQEFNAYVNKFPGGDRAALALLNTGTAYATQNKLPEAIRTFTRIIYDYPSSESISSALFKRAQAELAMQERQTAIDDFKNIVDKYPTAPEAELAKAELKKLGVGEAKPPTRRKAP